MKIEIRTSEIIKVPLYMKELEKVKTRSKNIGLESSLKEWAEEIKIRRLEWLKNNIDKLKLEGSEVRKGYQLIILEYMGIKPEEAPIIKETENKIVWRAYDFCPYLEAIKKTGLDTRDVCKHATEMPVQALLDILNPNLHYSRNYKKIRPYSKYCEETIELVLNNRLGKRS